MADTWSSPLVVIVGVAAVAIVAIIAIALLPSTPGFRQMVVGVTTSPELVGLMRSLLVYVTPIAVSGAVAYVYELTDPRLLPLVPLLVGALRIIEGRLDALAKPQQNAVDPPKISGSGSGNPAG